MYTRNGLFSEASATERGWCIKPQSAWVRMASWRVGIRVNPTLVGGDLNLQTPTFTYTQKTKTKLALLQLSLGGAYYLG